MNVPYVENEAIWRAADEFRASAELAGNDILRNEYDQFQRRMADADPCWHEIEGMRTHVAKHIAPRFGVNHQVIETRFAHERIWPLE